MSADNMPPLPSAVRHDFVGDDTEDLFTADQMHAYARTYAAEQVRELVEALEDIASVKALGDSDMALDCVREHAREVLVKHKGQA